LRIETDEATMIWLTTQQVAERWQVGRDTVRALIAAGQIEAMLISVSKRSKKPRYRVSLAAVEQFEADRQTRQATPVAVKPRRYTGPRFVG
jgi:excisionase family DNA binding protein